jgi:hypothetical protein
MIRESSWAASWRRVGWSWDSRSAALQVDRRDPEVRVPELALDDDERDAFASHLNGVCVSKLMWREAATYAGPCGRVAQLRPCGAR